MKNTSSGPKLEPRLLPTLIEPYGLAVNALAWIRSSQNCVYEHAGDPPSIIRISHGRGRTLEQVEAELAWIADLAARGFPVCPAIPSVAGRVCERIVQGNQEFLVVRFQRAPGRKVELADSNSAVYCQLGELTARLHEVSFSNRGGPKSKYARPQWFDSRLLMADLARYCESQPVFRDAVARLVAELAEQTRDSLGLLHADIHFGNLFLNESQQPGMLWIFDFDNCEFGSVEQDLATVLYDAIYCRVLNRFPPEEFDGQMRDRWTSFLRGYHSVRRGYSINENWLRQFLVLREAIIYLHYCRTLDLSTVSPAFLAGLEEMRTNVELGRPAFLLELLSAG